MDNSSVQYTEDNIRSLDWKEHIQQRPGMYIGKLGDGSSPDDGIYILIKEVIDNCIDEYVMGHGKKVDISIVENTVRIRDYGRGIPLGKVVDCVSKINTGGKYDSKAFKKSVGLNGVGTKAVNALSSNFKVRSFREGKVKLAVFENGNLIENPGLQDANEPNGTEVVFYPNDEIFKNLNFEKSL
jgi:Type IIA topoisomerase (DNA gyrase/topo II, topoisomerase IV), B subunit